MDGVSVSVYELWAEGGWRECVWGRGYMWSCVSVVRMCMGGGGWV